MIVLLVFCGTAGARPGGGGPDALSFLTRVGATIEPRYVAPMLTSPNGGESWQVGTVHTVTWTPGDGDTVMIKHSTDPSFLFFNTIAASTENDGSYEWEVNVDPGNSNYVRVTTSYGLSDQSDAKFVIPAGVPPVLQSPNGGESWQIGGAQTITWTPGTGSKVKIELCRDYTYVLNRVWEELVAETGNDGSFDWTASGPATDDGHIRVTALTGSGADTSEGPVVIHGQPPQVISPNGGETWNVNETHTITWTPGDGASAKIQVRREDVGSWSTIVGNTPNDGSYDWTVTSPTTTEAMIRVISNDAFGQDDSDAHFTIGAAVAPVVTAPNGGELWQIGSSHAVTWTPGTGSAVKIELSRVAYQTSWETLVASTENDGTWNWSVAGPVSQNVRVRVTSLSGAGSDSSNADACICGQPPQVISPDGGETWNVGESHAIAWTPGDGASVRIQLRRSDVGNWSDIVGSTSNDGSYDWTVSSPTTSEAMVRVISADTYGRDESDAHFTIGAAGPSVVTSPNGGELWQVGTSHPITWTPGTGAAVKIEMCRDMLHTYNETLVASTENDGVWDWTVTAPVSPYFRVRVTSLSAAGSDSSNADSWICGVPPEVTAPNGGETWSIGESRPITWTPGDGATVKIQLRRSDVVAWSDIAGSTSNDGSYDWTVTGPTTTEAMIRVVSNDTYGRDESNGHFAIGATSTPPTVTTPNGGEDWIVGTSRTITWTPGSGATATIDLSRDNGGSWETLFTGIVNDGQESWPVTNPPTDQALIRITTAAGVDASNSAFTISSSDVTPPTASVTGGDDEWHNAPVDLSVTAADEPGGSGVLCVWWWRNDEPNHYQTMGSTCLIAIPAPSDHTWDGDNTIWFCGEDVAGNTPDPVTTCWHVKIDTRAPVTKAPARARVRRGKIVALKYRIADEIPNGGTAHAVKILIKKRGGKTVKTLRLGTKPVNTALTAKFRCRLAKKTYTYSVYAVDAAGNAQSRIGKNKLIVR